ncbi:MAG: hydroxymethylglutaryl-CoA lyase [Bacteroidota bacterium]
MLQSIKLVECPRDAMQGWKKFIPTQTKIAYLNSLLQVGFDTLDCGSFVSSKAIPQMADTAQVISQVSLEKTSTKLLCIVANERGAAEAMLYSQISFVGFPFSVSPTFQMRNTNSSIEESFERVQKIQALCLQHNKILVIYISMGFGNPYGDKYDTQLVLKWVEKMVEMGITIISIADTVGVATPLQVEQLMSNVIPAYPQTEIGVHLHSTPTNWQEKIEAALTAGCLRFDGALKGIGGCPMANDDLVGNMDTELMIPYFKARQKGVFINEAALAEASALAAKIFI